MKWSPREYDRLERAVARGDRVRLWRGGNDVIVVPQRVGLEFGVEMLTARHAGTGDSLQVEIDDIEAFEVLG